MSVRFGIGRGVYGMGSGGVWRRRGVRDRVSRSSKEREKEILRMRRAVWNGLAACIAIVAFAVSPAALAAAKKTPTAEASTASKSSKSDKIEKVNLNTADEKTIAGAKGVGDKLAQEFVKNRPYKTWEDVSKVKGVGSGKKLESLKTVLKLTEGVGAPAATGNSSASSSPSSPSKQSSSSSSKLAPGTKININTASAEELDKLPEIGPVKAKAIVDYRNANGKFASPEDIMKVPGIKEGTFAKIKDYVVVR
jgi:comEA protein